jgi:serine/threonine protein kinase
VFDAAAVMAIPERACSGACARAPLCPAACAAGPRPRRPSGGWVIGWAERDLKHGRLVAIKVLRPELAAAVSAERFLREIEIAATLSHPNILPLHDSGEADGLLYYVMPYVEGDSLRARLDREGSLSLEEAIGITREVCDALGHAHERGLIHRDIKPENILFLAGHAVVSDFGIARATGQARGSRRTETGLAIGTFAYMSPEQATGEADVDARTDVYAAACVLFELLGGAPPWTTRGAAGLGRVLHQAAVTLVDDGSGAGLLDPGHHQSTDADREHDSEGPWATSFPATLGRPSAWHCPPPGSSWPSVPVASSTGPDGESSHPERAAIPPAANPQVLASASSFRPCFRW